MKKRKTAFNLQKTISSSSDHKKEGSQGMTLSHFLTFGSVLVAIITLVATKVQLPAWAITVIVLYLLAVIVWALWSPLKQLTEWLQEKMGEKQLAKTFYPPLQDITKEFSPLIENQRSNILSLLEQVNGWSETVPIDSTKNKLIYFDTTPIAIIRDWLKSIQERLGLNRLSDFPFLAGDFGILVFRYHHFCIQAHNHLEALAVNGKLTEQRLRELRQQWNLCRESYIGFLKKWESLSREINQTAGKQICLEYYEPLKTLS